MIFSTKSADYYYSIIQKHLFTISPILRMIILKHQNDLDFSFQVHSDNNYQDELIGYYYNKYKMLESGGFFNQYNSNDCLSSRINSHEIELNLANIRQIVFEVTQKCNLSCRYCAFGENYNNHEFRENKNMNFEMASCFIKYILNLKEINNKSTQSYLNISFYGGEPLLNFQLIKKIVEYLTSLGLEDRQIGYSMTTNGLLLNKEYVEYFIGSHTICVGELCGI